MTIGKESLKKTILTQGSSLVPFTEEELDKLIA